MTAKTNAQRQDTHKKKLAAAGIKEVRGILAHCDDHPAVRTAARGVADKLARKRAKTPTKE